MGTGADMITMPFGSLLTGFCAGPIAALGYIYLTPLLERKLGLHDTAGIHNLHGMPGILGGIVGGISASFADMRFGPDLKRAFPLVASGARTAI
jgi:ammonium transporter Rh